MARLGVGPDLGAVLVEVHVPAEAQHHRVHDRHVHQTVPHSAACQCGVTMVVVIPSSSILFRHLDRGDGGGKAYERSGQPAS